ncbi:hypothetical protein SHL_00049 [Pseudomonas phage shl2]|uniref:Uncharacterized protein n=1 Tax=Pseudomonas phage shl2 TaxID=1729933 RepID=A0A160SYA1_9CAUD|nr:hypothetical protein HOV57_gp49 [Pseudomonas phage shl2]CUR50739.1 hypothetical protein SHL_00049 [Pseudomonas phage shl2]
MRNPLTGPLPEAPKEDPKDARIRQLEQRVRELEGRLSDYSWEASARHAAATGGTL